MIVLLSKPGFHWHYFLDVGLVKIHSGVPDVVLCICIQILWVDMWHTSTTGIFRKQRANKCLVVGKHVSDWGEIEHEQLSFLFKLVGSAGLSKNDMHSKVSKQPCSQAVNGTGP